MPDDDIEQEHNLYDPEHREWFVYDPELFSKAYDEVMQSIKPNGFTKQATLA